MLLIKVSIYIIHIFLKFFCRPQGVGGFGTEGGALGSINMDQQLAGRFTAPATSSPFSAVGGNPFGWAHIKRIGVLIIELQLVASFKFAGRKVLVFYLTWIITAKLNSAHVYEVLGSNVHINLENWFEREWAVL